MKSGFRRQADMRTILGLACCAVLMTGTAKAEPVRGRIQLQTVYAQDDAQSLAAALGAKSRSDLLGDARLEWKPQRDHWRFDLAWRVGFDAGDTPKFEKLQAATQLFPAPPPTSWWDLGGSIVHEPHLTAAQRIDRLSVTYTSAHLVLRAGRQALTWGAGLVFRPMDLFDPFAPNSTDTEYKPGTDMVYGQYLFDDGSDIEAVIVPRPAHRGGELTANGSSFALRAHTALGAYQTTWMIARDHGDTIAAIGINGALGGATWNLEVLPALVKGGDANVSMLANISDAGTLFGRDITWFGEYFRNGYGLYRRHYTVSQLPAALVGRLLRGQLFNTGRDYAALGAQYQWTPLVQIKPTLIANLDDQSLYLLGEATWSLNDNLNLVVGAQTAIGPKRTEFGGLPLYAAMPPYLTQPARAYIQIRQYF
jgi:hypothetical protein